MYSWSVTNFNIFGSFLYKSISHAEVKKVFQFKSCLASVHVDEWLPNHINCDRYVLYLDKHRTRILLTAILTVTISYKNRLSFRTNTNLTTISGEGIRYYQIVCVRTLYIFVLTWRNLAYNICLLGRLKVQRMTRYQFSRLGSVV